MKYVLLTELIKLHISQMNWITAKLHKYYLKNGHFSHIIITHLTTLLIFYYLVVITKKSKHTVFKLFSISVSSLNELSQSGIFWSVGFWFLLPHLLKTVSVTTPKWHQVQAGACKLLWLLHSSPGVTLTRRTPPTLMNS